MDQGVAAPHARLAAVTHPIVVIGRSLRGIDWNARDGLPVQLVFLVLTPADAADAQLRIGRDISRATYPAESRIALLKSENAARIVANIRAAMEQEQTPAE